MGLFFGIADNLIMENNDYRNIFTALPFPSLLIKPNEENFQVFDVNEQCLLLLGFSKQEILGSGLFFIMKKIGIDEAVCSKLKNALQKVVQTKTRQGLKNLKLRGESKAVLSNKFINIDFVPVKDAGSQLEYIVVTGKNVTQNVIQEAVMKSREQYLHFVKESRDGLYVLDKEGKFTSVNKHLANLAGLPQEEMLGMSFLPFCAPEDREEVLRYFQTTIMGETVNFEGSFISTTGKKLLLDITLIPIKNQGQINGAYGIAKDVTLFKRNEKAIVEKRKFLEVSSAFIGFLLENNLQNQELTKAFAMVGETVDIDRVYYFEVHEHNATGETLLSQKIEWSGNHAEPQINNEKMQDLPASMIGGVLEPLQKNLPFMATLNELGEGNLREIFISQEIKAMLLLPIFVRKKLCGFIGFDDCRKERNWQEHEIIFLKGLAQSLSNAWEKSMAEDGLEQREADLKKSEQKFKALVQEGADLMAILDSSGTYTFVSDTTTNILGIAPHELIGKSPFDFIHEEDKRQLEEELSHLNKKKRIRTSPFRFKDAKDKWRWIETTATNLTKDPAIGGIVTNSRDITIIKEQAEEIYNINERYRLAATATQDIMYDWNLETDEVTRFFQGIKQLFGYSENEVQRRGFWREHIHPDELKELKVELQDALANPEQDFLQTSYRFKRADGTYAYIVDRGYIIRDRYGKAIRHIGASSDVSDIKANEEALREANERFKMAMKATNETIWDWRVPSNKVIRSNNFTKVYGYGINKTTSCQSFWMDKIVAEDKERVLGSLTAALKDKKQKKWKEEYCLYKANGERAHVLDRASIRRDENGEVIRMVGAVLDVTEYRELLKKTKEQNRVLKEVAWEQSHIVRAPLARIQGLLQLFELDAFNEISKEEVIGHIKTSAGELDAIIREIVRKTGSVGRRD